MEEYDNLLSVAVYHRAIILINGAIATIFYPLLIYLAVCHTPRETNRFVKYPPTLKGEIVRLRQEQPNLTADGGARSDDEPNLTLCTLQVNFAAKRHKFTCNILNVATTAWIYSIILMVWQPVPLFPYMGKVDSLSVRSDKRTCRHLCTSSMMYVFYDGFHLQLCHYQANFCDKPFCDEQIVDPSKASTIHDLLIIANEREPTLVGYQYTRPLTITYLATLVLILSMYTIVIVTINLKIRHQFQGMRDLVNSTTYRLQVMVYRAFLMTTISLLVFNFIPISVAAMTIINWIPNYYVTMGAYTVQSFLAPVSILNIIWMIPPYKRAAKRLLFKEIRKDTLVDATKVNPIETTHIESSVKL
ncbi:hypothetical protein DdX_20431 [Ditylenchus destructor]|uniref:Uncharacterized protein n=1 Tax=Ditylenchus destructor TaxID=166010 RepID=A0AAD4QTM1_9BILA|nr:hypothetical protein DdX_20431 [Ditylenchus destructor]